MIDVTFKDRVLAVVDSTCDQLALSDRTKSMSLRIAEKLLSPEYVSAAPEARLLAAVAIYIASRLTDEPVSSKTLGRTLKRIPSNIIDLAKRLHTILLDMRRELGEIETIKTLIKLDRYTKDIDEEFIRKAYNVLFNEFPSTAGNSVKSILYTYSIYVINKLHTVPTITTVYRSPTFRIDWNDLRLAYRYVLESMGVELE